MIFSIDTALSINCIPVLGIANKIANGNSHTKSSLTYDCSTSGENLLFFRNVTVASLATLLRDGDLIWT